MQYLLTKEEYERLRGDQPKIEAEIKAEVDRQMKEYLRGVSERATDFFQRYVQHYMGFGFEGAQSDRAWKEFQNVFRRDSQAEIKL